MLAVCSLVFAATDTAYRCALIAQGLAKSRIPHATSAVTRTRIPLISFCTVQLWTLCAAHSLVTICLSTTVFPKLCAVEDLQVCHEFFQNAFCCYKFSAKIEKTLSLRVTEREVMTLFLKSASFGAASRDFRRSWPRKVVISKKIKKRSLPFSLLPVMLLDIKWNRFQGWCSAKFVQLISWTERQKVWETLLYDFWLRSWIVAQLLGLHGLPSCPHPSEEIGQQHQHEIKYFFPRYKFLIVTWTSNSFNIACIKGVARRTKVAITYSSPKGLSKPCI